jgi:hypothetical protein
MNMMKLLCVVVALAACGSKQKNDTMQVDETNEQANTVPDNSANMIPAEKMDEVSQALKRKQMIVSRCLATAMENKEVPRGTHGKVTFEIVVDPSGKVSSVKVNKSDIQAQSVIDCAKHHVEEVSVSALPHQYETSFTYAMEAN